jgi:tartrate-resistant acid phosphatase type 5
MDLVSRRGVLGGVAALAAPNGLLAQPPQPVLQPELTFFTLGDWGRHGEYEQRPVAQAMKTWAQDVRPSFVMTVGDNFYQAGLGWPFEQHWKTSWSEVYDQSLLDLTWVPALGNHDYWGDIGAQVRMQTEHPSWYTAKSSYHVFRPEVHLPEAARHGIRRPLSGKPLIDIFVIDTSVMHYPYFGATFGRAKRGQFTWLEERLSGSDAEWKLIFGHHAIFSGGDHGRSKVIGERLQQIIEEHDVQAYVCGHDHDLQHIQHGRDKAPHYILTGGGSKIDGRDVKPVDGAVFQRHAAGFTVFRIQGPTLYVDFVGHDGTCLHQAKVPKVVADASKVQTILRPSSCSAIG